MDDQRACRTILNKPQTAVVGLCCPAVFLRDWTVSKIGKVQGVTEIDQESQRRGQPV